MQRKLYWGSSRFWQRGPRTLVHTLVQAAAAASCTAAAGPTYAAQRRDRSKPTAQRRHHSCFHGDQRSGKLLSRRTASLCTTNCRQQAPECWGISVSSFGDSRGHYEPHARRHSLPVRVQAPCLTQRRLFQDAVVIRKARTYPQVVELLISPTTCVVTPSVLAVRISTGAKVLKTGFRQQTKKQTHGLSEYISQAGRPANKKTCDKIKALRRSHVEPERGIWEIHAVIQFHKPKPEWSNHSLC